MSTIKTPNPSYRNLDLISQRCVPLSTASRRFHTSAVFFPFLNTSILYIMINDNNNSRMTSSAGCWFMLTLSTQSSTSTKRRCPPLGMGRASLTRNTAKWRKQQLGWKLLLRQQTGERMGRGYSLTCPCLIPLPRLVNRNRVARDKVTVCWSTVCCRDRHNKWRRRQLQPVQFYVFFAWYLQYSTCFVFQRRVAVREHEWKRYPPKTYLCTARSGFEGGAVKMHPGPWLWQVSKHSGNVSVLCKLCQVSCSAGKEYRLSRLLHTDRCREGGAR